MCLHVPRAKRIHYAARAVLEMWGGGAGWRKTFLLKYVTRRIISITAILQSTSAQCYDMGE